MQQPGGRNPERLRRLVPAILLAASLLSVTISTRSLAGIPERVGLSVLGFFQRGFAALGDFVSGSIASIAELRRLRRDYEELVAKMERYDRLERDYADIRAENGRLREQLGFAEGLRFRRIPARIVAKDPENLYATITIDKGVGEGVRKNMPVVAVQEGVEGLVGRVFEVGRGASIVVPLYDVNSYIAARLSTSRYEGLVAGSGSAEEPLVMKYVRKRAREEVQPGELVLSSGYESLYPPDLVLGRVEKVRSLEYETSLEIDLDPVLDFSRLEYLFVIIPEEGKQSMDASAGGP